MGKNTRLAKVMFSTFLALIGIAGLGNLAISQIHIGVMTDSFMNEIGFYFFLFIIFGLVAFMNAMNMRKDTSGIGNSILTLILGFAASGAGGVYIKLLLDDIAIGKLLTASDIALSKNIVMASIIVYFLGSIIIVATHKAAKGK